MVAQGARRTQGPSTRHTSPVIAIIGGLGAAICWAVATVASSRSSRMIGSRVVLAWIMIVGTIVGLPLALASGVPTAHPAGGTGPPARRRSGLLGRPVRRVPSAGHRQGQHRRPHRRDRGRPGRGPGGRPRRSARCRRPGSSSRSSPSASSCRRSSRPDRTSRPGPSSWPRMPSTDRRRPAPPCPRMPRRVPGSIPREAIILSIARRGDLRGRARGQRQGGGPRAARLGRPHGASGRARRRRPAAAAPATADPDPGRRAAGHPVRASAR